MANQKDNTFGATVINSRAVNFLLTKLRCKETSGRVSDNKHLDAFHIECMVHVPPLKDLKMCTSIGLYGVW